MNRLPPNTMGTDIEQYRQRICHSCMINSSATKQQKHKRGLYSYNHVHYIQLLSILKRICFICINILLPIGCVEQNPGPKESKQQNLPAPHTCIRVSNFNTYKN